MNEASFNVAVIDAALAVVEAARGRVGERRINTNEPLACAHYLMLSDRRMLRKDVNP